jgi:uncharacterized protein YaiI (UPF0178 family)
MGGIVTLVVLGLIAFSIFFVYKQIEFFVMSVNLYKKMIAQQDKIISLLSKGSTSETKKCPTCAEMIKIEAKKCHYCGEIFTKEDIDKTIEQRKNMLDGAIEGNYQLVEAGDTEAFCFGCKETSPVKGMYYNKKTDRYYHEKCLPSVT